MGTTQENKQNWLNSELLKAAGVVISLLSPLFVWICVSIFELKSDVAILKVKVDSITEIKSAIYNIEKDLQVIKIDMNTLKIKLDLHKDETSKGK